MDPSKLAFLPKTKSADSKKPLKPPLGKRSHTSAEDFSGAGGPQVRSRAQLQPGIHVVVPDQKQIASQRARLSAVKAQQWTKQQQSKSILHEPLDKNSHDNVHAQRDSIAKNANRSASNEVQADTSPQNESRFRAFTSITDQLLHSKRKENRKLKAIFGAIAGLLIGGLFYIVLVYSFGYTNQEAAIFASVVTVIMSICLAISSFCRCVIALVFPNVFTGKGRAVFLSVIFGILLSNQISNITQNAKETGNSMACITELAVNQTRALQKQLSQPLKEIQDYIKKQHKYMSNYGFGIKGTLQKIHETLGKVYNDIDSAKSAIAKAAQDCRRELGKVCSICSKIPFLDKPCEDACNEIRKVCDPLDHFNSIFSDVTGKVRLGMNEALQQFEVDVDVTGTNSGSTRISKVVPDIMEEVNRDIEAKAKTVQTVLTFCNKFLALSLLLIFVQAFFYLRTYLRKDSYDNVYITTQFRQMDQEVVEQGGESIFPLRKKESSLYVNTTAWTLNSTERAECKLGVLQVLLHFLLCLLVVFFDYALYYILSLLQKYDNIELDVEGQGQLRVNVKGKGFLSDFYRKMVEDINIDHNFKMNRDIGDCMPHPTEPSFNTLPVLLGLYFLAICFVLLRGYGLRLRRKISAYYYPEQEYDRMKYLHKQIRHKRDGFLKLKSSHKKNRLSFTAWLSSRRRCLSACRTPQDKVECTRCEQTESGSPGVQLTKCFGVKGGVQCDAVYCQDCLTTLDNTCPGCSFDNV